MHAKARRGGLRRRVQRVPFKKILKGSLSGASVHVGETGVNFNWCKCQILMVEGVVIVAVVSWLWMIHFYLCRIWYKRSESSQGL